MEYHAAPRSRKCTVQYGASHNGASRHKKCVSQQKKQYVFEPEADFEVYYSIPSSFSTVIRVVRWPFPEGFKPCNKAAAEKPKRVIPILAGWSLPHQRSTVTEWHVISTVAYEK